MDNNVINSLQNNVNDNPSDSMKDLNLFTADLVKSAVKKLKADKSDVSGQFTSDCLKAAPDIFFDKLASLFRSSLSHGYISQDLILCALSPIVKDPNGDISSSKNYRGIAISSLILKVFDNCLLPCLETSSPMMFSSLDFRVGALLYSVPGLFRKLFPTTLGEDQMSTAACLISPRPLTR
jgi:hypothetical protein